MDNYNAKMIILDTFFYEEVTIFHVENHLQNHNLAVNRTEIKRIVFELLKEGLIKLFEDPSHGKVSFIDANNDYIEDYWFCITKEGLSELNNHQKK